MLDRKTTNHNEDSVNIIQELMSLDVVIFPE